MEQMDTTDGAGGLAMLQPMSDLTSYSTEAGLVDGCRRQDVHAFEELYRQQGTRLKSVAYHIMGNHQDAEDAVQETFLKAFRSIGGFRERSTLKTWLCRIAVNVCYDMTRRRKTEMEFTAIHDKATAGPTMRLALDSVIRRLSYNYRTVFLLFAVEGMTHSEIAAVLEIPEGTSKSWLFEAKRELQQMLEAQR
jgi:RNA polymerase sigma-70 factor (ECF subfamily)